MSAPGRQAEDETEPRPRAETSPSQVLVPEPADTDEGAHFPFTFMVTLKLASYQACTIPEKKR